MKAIQVSSFGAPEVLRLAELPDPAPGPGEVAIDVTHAAVGLIDVFIRQGLYRDRPGLPQPPYVPGLEVAGTVRALGEGVAGFEVGEPVMTLSFVILSFRVSRGCDLRRLAEDTVLGETCEALSCLFQRG